MTRARQIAKLLGAKLIHAESCSSEEAPFSLLHRPLPSQLPHHSNPAPCFERFDIIGGQPSCKPSPLALLKPHLRNRPCQTITYGGGNRGGGDGREGRVRCPCVPSLDMCPPCWSQGHLTILLKAMINMCKTTNNQPNNTSELFLIFTLKT